MNRHTHNPKEQSKYTQSKILLQAFFSKPKTMLEVEKETGISRSSITRYVSDWETENRIKIVYSGICKISGRSPVKHYTTNPVFFDKVFTDISSFNQKQRLLWFERLKVINQSEEPVSISVLYDLLDEVKNIGGYE